MSEQTDKLKSLLLPFGLSPDESQIYLELLEKGVSTALQISRNIHMGRTKVYRVLDKLIVKQLVAQQVDEQGMKFLANDPIELEYLVSEQEGRLQSLRQTLPAVVSTLKNRVSSGQPGSKTLYYRGKEGLLQVNYNLLRAENAFYSFEVDNADAYLTHNDAELIRQELVKNKIKAITLTNKTYFPAFTDVAEVVEKYWEIRYIDPQIFHIKSDIFIYNNVYAICNYVHNWDVFCLEIYNQPLVDMQQQLFLQLWRQAKPLTIINHHGEARLE